LGSEGPVTRGDPAPWLSHAWQRVDRCCEVVFRPSRAAWAVTSSTRRIGGVEVGLIGKDARRLEVLLFAKYPESLTSVSGLGERFNLHRSPGSLEHDNAAFTTGSVPHDSYQGAERLASIDGIGCRRKKEYCQSLRPCWLARIGARKMIIYLQSTISLASVDYLSLALEVFPDDLTQIFRELFGGVLGEASVGELESGSAHALTHPDARAGWKLPICGLFMRFYQSLILTQVTLFTSTSPP